MASTDPQEVKKLRRDIQQEKRFQEDSLLEEYCRVMNFSDELLKLVGLGSKG